VWCRSHVRARACDDDGRSRDRDRANDATNVDVDGRAISLFSLRRVPRDFFVFPPTCSSRFRCFPSDVFHAISLFSLRRVPRDFAVFPPTFSMRFRCFPDVFHAISLFSLRRVPSDFAVFPTCSSRFRRFPDVFHAISPFSLRRRRRPSIAIDRASIVRRREGHADEL